MRIFLYILLAFVLVVIVAWPAAASAVPVVPSAGRSSGVSNGWIGETAWSSGCRYVQNDNWATFSPYIPNLSMVLWAAQSKVAGIVNFVPTINGKVYITVILYPGWRFSNELENIKIEGYTNRPSEEPIPDQFPYKSRGTDRSKTVMVPPFKYYGVNVDVERFSIQQ